MGYRFDLNKFLQNPIVWKLLYHFVIVGCVIQYVWMVIWLLVKSNHTWTDYGWLVALLVIAQFLLGSGVISIFILSQIAHARKILIPVTRFWRCD